MQEEKSCCHAYLAYVPGLNICLFLRFLRYVIMIDSSFICKCREGVVRGASLVESESESRFKMIECGFLAYPVLRRRTSRLSYL